MYQTAKFKKKLIATVIASTAVTGFSGFAVAQDESVEEVMVTGIRASLERSMDTKRNSAGVVDAISSEDIGKFPDTNLAESLQRITGVSISRSNGEGSQITVRGFGADNNMVTLNGRTMPAASTSNGGGGDSRAFDFANLASEGISGVEVYKTGKANITTGGIGATVNVKTAKPLDNPGLVASAGVKAVMDTTNRAGDDVTPEASGLFSWANDDSTFGVAVSASHQQRDSGTVGATVNDWGIYTWDSVNAPQRTWNNANAEVINAPDEGQLYSRFYDLRYEFIDTQRTRDNAQLTLQFAPTEDFTATVDYTFAENEIKSQLGQAGNWMQQQGNFQAVEFDNQEIATMIYAKEAYGNAIDEGFEQQWREQTNTLDSLGVNLSYQVTDALSFDLDVHDSEMHSRGTGPHGTGSIRMALAAPVVVEREWFFGGEFPTYLNVYDDSRRQRPQSAIDQQAWTPNGQVDPSDLSSTMLNLDQADQLSSVTQIKLDGRYELDNGHFDFGIESREMESNTRRYASGNISLGNWDGNYPGEFGNLIRPFDLQGEFDDFSPKAGGYGFIANAAELYEAAMTIPRYSSILPAKMNQSAHNIVVEDMQSAYFQVGLEGNVGNMPFSVLTGLRYETTDVDSSSLSSAYFYRWESDNDVSINVDTSKPQTLASAKASYDNLLPSFDLTLNVTDDVVSRFSFSKTIARAGLGSLGVSASNFGSGGGPTYLGAIPTASASNPGLLPLESTNFDLSVEWYYDEGSYASIGVFEKNVKNFIGSEQVNRSLLGIRNSTNGPRVEAAAAQLKAAGIAVSDVSLFSQTAYNEFVVLPGGGLNAAWVAEFGNTAYTGTPEQDQFILAQPGWDIYDNASDPLAVFRTNTPNNGREAKIHGIELAVQHFFGDTGFGVQANYTLVRGDVGFDNLGSPTESQFALVGLSDTANLSGIYENDRFQARIAYNWRGEYLNETSRGGFSNPRYIEDYSQIDLNLSYSVTDALTVSLEGINITGEDSRSHGRNYAMMWDMYDLGARYQIGARYTF
ncbi:TonB-dependent receptor [Cellvibrio sp. pealriver]|uniref:TonB-dependent receptor n=1 Tax=Cellvibrio sp. pealriver TaxID=1622269 RepID=UPI00066FCEA4|nr:TonB-dependent receptor [Cellvibrio sp. pealriver]